MTRIQPILTKSETELVNRVAELTQSKKTDVIKNALAVYHWFVRQAVTGAHVVARKSTGEEVELKTPELAALEAQGHRLSAEELGLLGSKLASARSPEEAARLRELITRGFYGI